MGQAQVANLCYWGLGDTGWKPVLLGSLCYGKRLTPSKPNAVRRGTAAQTRPAKHVAQVFNLCTNSRHRLKTCATGERGRRGD